MAYPWENTLSADDSTILSDSWTKYNNQMNKSDDQLLTDAGYSYQQGEEGPGSWGKMTDDGWQRVQGGDNGSPLDQYLDRSTFKQKALPEGWLSLDINPKSTEFMRNKVNDLFTLKPELRKYGIDSNSSPEALSWLFTNVSNPGGSMYNDPNFGWLWKTNPDGGWHEIGTGAMDSMKWVKPLVLGAIAAMAGGGLMGGEGVFGGAGAEGLSIGGAPVDFGLGSGYLGSGSIGLNLPSGAGALGSGLDFGATMAGASSGMGAGIGSGLSLGGAESLGTGLDFASSLADPVGSMAIEGGANLGPSVLENAAGGAETAATNATAQPSTMGIEQSGALNQTPISLEDFAANMNADMPIGASERLITEAGMQMPQSSLLQKAVDAGIPFDLATKLVGKGINVNDLLSGIQKLYTSGKQKDSADQLMRAIQQTMGAQDPFASGRTNATNAYNSYLTDPTKWANEFAPLLDEVARRARRTNAQQGRNFYIGDNGLPRGSGGGAVDFFNQMAPAFYGLQQKKLSDLAQQATQGVPNYGAYMSALANATGMQNSANSAWAGALPFIWNGLGGADTFKSAWDTVGNWFA